MKARVKGPLVGLLCAFALMGHAPGAAAEDTADSSGREVAASRFAEGERAFARGDFARAGEAFEAAYAAAPHEIALWNAARSWEKAREEARAANLYRRYLRVAGPGALDTERAAASLAALASRLGRLEIVAPGASTLAVDGRPVDDGVQYVHPGAHLVEVSGPRGALRREASVAAGATVSVLLEPPSDPAPEVAPAPAPPASTASPAPAVVSPASPPVPAPPASAAPPSTSPRTAGPPWLFLSFAGLSVASTTLLVASGIDVLVARSDYDELKVGRSPEEQQALIDEGAAKTDRTNVLLGVTAGLFVATAGVALITFEREPAAPEIAAGRRAASLRHVRIGPGGVTLDGSF